LKIIGIALAAIFLMIYIGIHYYIGYNVWRWSGMKRKKTIIIGTILLGFTYPVSELLENVLILKIVGSYWVAVLLYSVILLPIGNLVVYCSHKNEKVIKWTGTSILLMMVIVLGIGTYNAYHPIVKTYSISVDKKVKGEKNIRIVMATDMHFGLLSGKNHAKNLVETINKENPDLVLFSGDIIDDNPTPMIDKKLYKELRKIQPNLGVYAVLGNHDYRRKTEEFLAELEKANITVLRDKTIKLENGIVLIGREDKIIKERKNVKNLLTGVDKEKPVIMMDHQPYYLDIAEKNGVDLVVSGHTHKGQMFPGNFITSMIYENHHGYLKIGGMHSIVSSGYGFWGPPVRIGSRSEVVVIDAKFE